MREDGILRNNVDLRGLGFQHENKTNSGFNNKLF